MSSINVCYGCLSVNRQLFPIEEHAKLYRQLLLKKSYKNTQKRNMCWECHQILKNIHTFRMKITQAQKLLSNKFLRQPHSLSNLSVSTNVDDYQLILFEDEKINVSSRDMKLSINIKEEIEDYLNAEMEVYEDDDIKPLVKEEPKDEIDDNKEGVTKLEVKLVPIDSLVEKETENVTEEKIDKKIEQVKKKTRMCRQKYRTIIFDNIPDKKNYYDVVTIDQETALKWLEKKKQKSAGKRWQCQRCFCGYKQKKHYDRHLAQLHAQKKQFECDLCGVRVRTKSRMTLHVSKHYVAYSCKLCRQSYPARKSLYMHLVNGPHVKQLECRECGARFDCNKARDFQKHYRSAHGMPQCDYCGKRYAKKSNLEQHIQIRHSPFRCTLCDSGFRTRILLRAHNLRKHTNDSSERNYCVECDLQLPNSLRYYEHMKRSSKHRTKARIPCPECDRTYSRRCLMMNHYKLEHLHQSQWVCPHCGRSFLTGNKLKNHVKYIHEKAPKPKNHICSYCDKGFYTPRELVFHVRTHTGERPFACEQCSATFAQPNTLRTHVKSKHNK